MISNPRNGWCNFRLGNFKGSPSYLTDVPMELLYCFESYFSIGAGACFFDEEGSEFTLLLTDGECFVIENRESPHDFVKIESSPAQLAVELLRDLGNPLLDGWISWVPEYEDMTRQEKERRHKEMKEKWCALQDTIKKIQKNRRFET